MTVYFLLTYPAGRKKHTTQVCIDVIRIVDENDTTITFQVDETGHTSTMKKADILTIENDD